MESRALDGIGMWSALLEGLAHEEELLVFVHSAEVELEELLSRTSSGELGAPPWFSFDSCTTTTRLPTQEASEKVPEGPRQLVHEHGRLVPSRQAAMYSIWQALEAK